MNNVVLVGGGGKRPVTFVLLCGPEKNDSSDVGTKTTLETL